MSKIGRNDPCPCGSGRKYKKCCLRRGEVSELELARLRKTEGVLVIRLFQRVMEDYPVAIAEAWDEFCGEEAELPGEPEQAPPEFETIFLPWFLFNWVPDDIFVDDRERDYPESPIARHYLQKHPEQFSAYERRFIEEACAQPYSFFVVEGVEPGHSMRLRDLFLDRRVTVAERQASQSLRRGQILFTRVITVDGLTVMFGGAPFVFPPRYGMDLLEVREVMEEDYGPLDIDRLRGLDWILRDLFHEFREESQEPKLPVLHNTDGERLQPTKLLYRLKCTPREALEALISLSLDTVDDYLDIAEFDEEGELHAIGFPWLRKGNKQVAGMDNTVLGHLRIEGDRLTIDVNSQERADAIRRKITRRLGRRAEFERAVIESPEQMLEEMQNRPRPAAAAEEGEDLMQLPEVRAQIEEMARRHWQQWPDVPLPALHGQTPREAAKSPKGRRRLETLLMEFESNADPSQPFAPDVPHLRHELGLDAPER
ncbi:MAG: hypothetical protein D6720_10580 [Gammaproteobacteria bacterium]|nr:MAG: hypothetical protein D6720_10580 [Gammaproteobacteria bacterium]